MYLPFFFPSLRLLFHHSIPGLIGFFTLGWGWHSLLSLEYKWLVTFEYGFKAWLCGLVQGEELLRFFFFLPEFVYFSTSPAENYCIGDTYSCFPWDTGEGTPPVKSNQLYQVLRNFIYKVLTNECNILHFHKLFIWKSSVKHNYFHLTRWH